MCGSGWKLEWVPLVIFFFNSPFLIIYIFKVKKVRQHTRLPVKSFHTMHRRDWLIKKKSSKYCRTSYLKYTLQSTKGIKHRISLATVLTMMAEEETEKFYLQSRSISKRVEPFLKNLSLTLCIHCNIYLNDK